MRPRRAGKWSTSFGGFVSGFTIARLAEEVGVTKGAVYHWVEGRFAPRDSAAQAIVRASAGALTLEDVYRHRHEVGRDGAGDGAGPGKR